MSDLDLYADLITRKLVSRDGGAVTLSPFEFRSILPVFHFPASAEKPTAYFDENTLTLLGL